MKNFIKHKKGAFYYFGYQHLHPLVSNQTDFNMHLDQTNNVSNVISYGNGIAILYHH